MKITDALIHRPPSYVSAATLARELDVSESTVAEMVRKGVLPKPVKLSSGCARWRWADVEMAIGSMAPGVPAAETDPFLKGAIDATATQ
jgi:predicted DNA-binding transcriptional regulator AlpA